jgi:molybdate transport system substrate-binding protein
MLIKRLLIVLSIALAVPLSAADISTLAGAAVQGPLIETARLFEQQTGHVVAVRFDTVPRIMRSLTGDSADVLIATSAGVDQAVKDGKAVANTRAALGRIGIGVAISRGGTRPDISTVDALKTALTAADALVISQGTSGTYVQRMLGELGIAEQIKGKLVQVASGVMVMERLGTPGRNEIGLTMLSEVMYGEAHGGGTLVGPLPAAIQNRTGYDAVMLTGSRQPEVARQFLMALRSPAARKLMVANGWEVPGVAARPVLALEP